MITSQTKELLLRVLGIREDEEFVLWGQDDLYKFSNGEMLTFVDKKWIPSDITLNTIIHHVAKSKWLPQVGEEYWCAWCFTGGVKSIMHVWDNSEMDNYVRDLQGVYHTKEESDSKARELGQIE